MREYYIKMMLPFAISIGIREEEFWKMTMRSFNSHVEGFKLRQKIRDEEMWLQARYNLSAFETVMAHFGVGLAGKKSNSKYLEKPFTQMADENNSELTDEEINMQIRKAIFAEEQWSNQLKRSGMKETVI